MGARHHRGWGIVLGLLLTAAVTADAAPTTPAVERLTVTVDKSELLDVPSEPFTRVAVTNPNIAEVIVISPTQLLINGKATGVTSLLLFYKKGVRHFDLTVVGAARRDAEAHSVLIQRADKLTNHVFVRDDDSRWIELGATRSEPEAPKK
jgi:pilus assembly protein CpaC